MRFHYHVDDISLYPLKKDLAGYSLSAFRQDLLAGLSVALLTIPQAMAYSLLAGLPLYCGLFAAIYSSIAAALFGSSRHLVVGPSNAIAILLQAGTSEILFTYYRGYSGPEREMIALQVLTQLTFLVGIIQILAAGCKLGRLTHFVSHSVIVGYIAGTAIAVIVNQLFVTIGLNRMSGVHSIYDRAVYFVTHIHHMHIPTAIIGLSSLILLIFLKRLHKHMPAAVITFVIMGAVVYFFDLSSYSDMLPAVDPYLEEHAQKIMVVRDEASLSDLMPPLELPDFNPGILNNMLPIAFAIALLSIMETISVSKSIAASSGQRLSINQEIFGIGVGNLVSSFIVAMPVSGSPSRSCTNYVNGAKTRFAAIINAITVGLFLLCFGPLIHEIPLAALSALLLYSATTIINPKQFFLCLKATSSDAFVLWITLLSCIFLSLDIAFYFGTALSIILYLKKAAIPQLKEYDIDPSSGELKVLDYSLPEQHHKPIRVIKVEGELFFGAADLFQTTLKTIAEDDTSTRVIILQLKNARDIDATGCLALQQLYEYLKGSKRQLLLCGITWQVWEVLSDSGLVELIGKENMYMYDERNPHHFMQKALRRARELAEKTEEPKALIVEVCVGETVKECESPKILPEPNLDSPS